MSNPIKVINHEGFIADLKTAHKGQGRLKLRGRNSNRAQFYGDRFYYRDGTVAKHRFAQDLPTRYATYFAFYGNETVLNSVANIYKKAGINVFYNV